MQQRQHKIDFLFSTDNTDENESKIFQIPWHLSCSIFSKIITLVANKL